MRRLPLRDSFGVLLLQCLDLRGMRSTQGCGVFLPLLRRSGQGAGMLRLQRGQRLGLLGFQRRYLVGVRLFVRSQLGRMRRLHLVQRLRMLLRRRLQGSALLR